MFITLPLFLFAAANAEVPSEVRIRCRGGFDIDQVGDLGHFDLPLSFSTHLDQYEGLSLSEHEGYEIKVWISTYSGDNVAERYSLSIGPAINGPIAVSEADLGSRLKLSSDFPLGGAWAECYPITPEPQEYVAAPDASPTRSSAE